MSKLPDEILQELKRIEEEKFVNEYSKETFDDIFIPWLISDEKLEKDISKISSTFMLSKFMLTYIKYVTSDLQNRYDIPILTSKELVNEDKVEEVKSRIDEIIDDPLLSWFKKETSSNLVKILEKDNIEMFNEVIELGLIEDILLTALEEGKENSVYGYHYEIFYQLHDRLKEANLVNEKSESRPNLHLYDVKVLVYNGDDKSDFNESMDVEYAVVDEDVEKSVEKVLKYIKR